MPLSEDLRWKSEIRYTVRSIVDAKTDAYARKVARRLRKHVEEIIDMAMAERNTQATEQPAAGDEVRGC